MQKFEQPSSIFSKTIYVILYLLILNNLLMEGDSRKASSENKTNTMTSINPRDARKQPDMEPAFEYVDIEGDAPNSSICRKKIANYSEPVTKCYIAKYFAGCQYDTGFFQYLTFEYCYFNGQVIPTIFIIIWLIILLCAFAVISDAFFGTSLIALTRAMRMSENLAGVTLLAFGNGAPDVFSAVTAITTGDPDAPDEGLGLGFLLGSGLLVNTVTAGIVIILKPFKISRRPFLKDTIFYIIAVAWAASILIRRTIGVVDSVGFLVLYLIYVFTTWAGSTIMKRKRTITDGGLFPNFIGIHFERLHAVFRTSWYKTRLSISTCLNKCPCMRSFTDKYLIKSDSEASPKGVYDADYDLSDESNRNSSGILRVKSNGTTFSTDNNNQPIHGYKTPKIQIIETSDIPLPNINSSPTIINPNALTPDDKLWNFGPNSEVIRTKRSSSLTSSGFIPNAVPSSAPVHRDRHRRYHSVIRRRQSGRMSGGGSDMLYMVKWIMANRDQEEESLGRGDNRFTASGRSTTHDEESQYDMNSHLRLRKGSRLQASMTTPVIRSSSFLSEVSDDEEAMHKRESMARTIKLNLVNEKENMQREFDEMSEVEQPANEHGEMNIPEGETEMDKNDTARFEQWAMQSVWRHFLYYMIPINLESWYEHTFIGKLVEIFKAPIFIIFRITIPTVVEELSYEEELHSPRVEDITDISECKPESHRGMDTVVEENESITEKSKTDESYYNSDSVLVDLECMHGWCKPLNVLQCIYVPTLWPFLLTANGKCIALTKIGSSSVPVFVPFLICGMIVAIIVHFTSVWNRPPHAYHRPFFATLGFTTSIIWIYALAHELVNSLEALGITWEISEAILGLSVMAFASSIGDITSNCMLARNGYPRIAYAACLGSPLFNLLVGAGLSYTIKICRGNMSVAQLSFTLTQALLFSCLLVVLSMNVLVALIFRFEFRRLYGICLVVIYLAFVTVAILIEVDVIVSPSNWNLLTGTE